MESCQISLQPNTWRKIPGREWRRKDCIPRLSTLAHQAAGTPWLRGGRCIMDGKKNILKPVSEFAFRRIDLVSSRLNSQICSNEGIFPGRGAILRRRQNHENENKNERENLSGILVKKRDGCRHYQI